jgi:hypothetical protein
MRLNLHESNPDVNGPRHHVQSTVYPHGFAIISALSDPCRPVSYLPRIVSFLRVVLISDFSVGTTLCFPSKSLAKMSSFFAWLEMISFVVILIAMPIRTPYHNTAHQIFFETHNRTQWSNQGLVFLLTLLTPCWCVAGYESTSQYHFLTSFEGMSLNFPR